MYGTLTFSMLKPDITRRNLTGAVNALIEQNRFQIIAQKRVLITEPQAKHFYGIHATKPFFDELIQTITAGPVVVQVLHRERAVEGYRELMGATDPKAAAVNTIRHLYGLSLSENSVHGSDSDENAESEYRQFFCNNDLLP